MPSLRPMRKLTRIPVKHMTTQHTDMTSEMLRLTCQSDITPWREGRASCFRDHWQRMCPLTARILINPHIRRATSPDVEDSRWTVSVLMFTDWTGHKGFTPKSRNLFFSF